MGVRVSLLIREGSNVHVQVSKRMESSPKRHGYYKRQSTNQKPIEYLFIYPPERTGSYFYRYSDEIYEIAPETHNYHITLSSSSTCWSEDPNLPVGCEW